MGELTWKERGQLWFRLGLRGILTLIVVLLTLKLGPGLVSVFAPFLLALVMAWCLAPGVKWLHEKLGVGRKAASLFLLLLVFAALGTLLWQLTAAGVREILALAGDWESLLATGQQLLGQVEDGFFHVMARLPAEFRTTADSLMDQLFLWLETVVPQLLSKGVEWATQTVKALPSFAVASIVFLMASYFITEDYPHLRTRFADRLPEGARYVVSMVKRAFSVGFGGYVKAEVILSVGVFFILLFGFSILRQSYTLLLALGLAVLDFIPILGAGTVMVPWALVAFFTGDVAQAVGLMAVWGVVAVFRRVAEPKVLGNQTGLSPIVSLISVYVGMKVAAVGGMVLGPVLCLVGSNVARSGILDRTVADIRLAARDISSILKGGESREEGPVEPEGEF